jgi:prophage regulatory protein
MRLLRLAQVCEVTGLSRMTIYRLEQRGEFPSRRRISANSVAWVDQDVLAWIDARPCVHSLHASAVRERSGLQRRLSNQ